VQQAYAKTPSRRTGPDRKKQNQIFMRIDEIKARKQGKIAEICALFKKYIKPVYACI
jgi:hypothetical protein